MLVYLFGREFFPLSLRHKAPVRRFEPLLLQHAVDLHVRRDVEGRWIARLAAEHVHEDAMPNLMRHHEQAFVGGELRAERDVHENSLAVSRRRAEAAVSDRHELHAHQESASEREAH